jgi:hypothetical protein
MKPSLRTLRSLIALSLLPFCVSVQASDAEKPLPNCRRVLSTPGPEDIALSRPSRTLYVSSHDRRNFGTTGKLYSVDLSKPLAELTAVAVAANYPAEFRPHGMSWVMEGGKERLYVISHAGLDGAKHTIEVFEKTDSGLAHIRTLKSPLLDSPNDLHVLPDGRIFVSSDHGPGGKFSQLIDDLFNRERSRISYFDGKDWSYLGPSVASGNGVFYSVENGREYLYRAVVFDRAIVKYELIKGGDGKPDLKEVRRIALSGGPDNIEPDDKGNLYVATHTSFFRFFFHTLSPNNLSPTHIDRVAISSGSVEPVYTNGGTEIPGASTGLAFENKLFVSQVFEDFLLVCPLGEPPLSAK